jgi:hypothetical protein
MTMLKALTDFDLRRRLAAAKYANARGATPRPATRIAAMETETRRRFLLDAGSSRGMQR